MVARRIIPCLDVRDGKVVKGVRFRDHEIVGDILERAENYAAQGADELVFYDITASPEGRTADLRWVEEVAKRIDIPFCVAGGIRSVAEAEARLRRGADKISVNTPALARPELVDELAAAFGAQCVVVGVDSLERDGNYIVYQNTGDPAKAGAAGRSTLDWIAEAQARGAGEIVLNCMDRDGVREGYDLAQLKRAREVLDIPLIASGGAGAAEDFRDVFRDCDVDGALAASVFHKDVLNIEGLKAYLAGEGIEVRHGAG
ncbi:MAG: imidazole glycerol phosphate synthase subunit HisF [Parvularculaceae bacterium]